MHFITNLAGFVDFLDLARFLDKAHRYNCFYKLFRSTTRCNRTGYKAMDQMTAERAGGKWGEYPAVYPHPIDQNILPHIDSFLETGYTKEEMKMVNETHKIFA